MDAFHIPKEMQLTPGGIFVISDKAYLIDTGGTGATSEMVGAEMSGWRGLRWAIVKETNEANLIPGISILSVPTDKGKTISKDQIEKRRKIAPLQPMIFTYRFHRPKERTLASARPHDYAIDVGLVADFEYPIWAFKHVHGLNRSTLIHDRRNDNPNDVDGGANRESKNYFGRLHDIIKVVRLPLSKTKNQQTVTPDVSAGAGDTVIPYAPITNYGDDVEQVIAAFNWSPPGATIRITQEGTKTDDGEGVTAGYDSAGGKDTPGKLWQPGGYVYDSMARQVSHISTVMLIDMGGDDWDLKTPDKEPITIIDIRHDAHFAKGGREKGKHMDGRIYFTGKAIGGDIQGQGVLGEMIHDEKLKNKDSDLKHETGQWRPMVKVPYSDGSKPNETGHPPPDGGHGTVPQPPVVYTGSPRRLGFGPSGLVGLSWLIPSLRVPIPDESQVVVRMSMSLSEPILTYAIKLQFAYQVIAKGGSLEELWNEQNFIFDSSNVRGDTNKFVKTFTTVALPDRSMINFKILRWADDIEDTYPGTLLLMETSWAYKKIKMVQLV